MNGAKVVIIFIYEANMRRYIIDLSGILATLFTILLVVMVLKNELKYDEPDWTLIFSMFSIMAMVVYYVLSKILENKRRYSEIGKIDFEIKKTDLEIEMNKLLEERRSIEL